MGSSAQIGVECVPVQVASSGGFRMVQVAGAGSGRFQYRTRCKSKGFGGLRNVLEGSSAGPSAGCRRRFRKILENVAEKVGRGFGADPVKLNRVQEKVPERSGRLGCRAREGSGEGLGGFGAKPRHFRFNKFRRRCLGGFGAEPSQVQKGSEEAYGEGSGAVWETLVQSQITWFRERVGAALRPSMFQQMLDQKIC